MKQHTILTLILTLTHCRRCDAFTVSFTNSNLLKRITQSSSKTSISSVDNHSFKFPLYAKASDANTSSDTARALTQQLDIIGGFDRWRYVQKMLDLETDPLVDNQLLFHVLQRYLTHPAVGPDSLASPERTRARLKLVQSILEETADNASIPALNADGSRLTNEDDPEKAVVSSSSNSVVSTSLEDLLPDPTDEEDADKSLWDGIAELHGKAAVAIDQKDPLWKARCLVARLLLFYDFLQKGIVVVEEEAENDEENVSTSS